MQRKAEPPSLAWALGCAALASLCAIVWLLPVDTQIALRWQSEHWPNKLWTLWTASLTHLSDAHLSVNLLALLCLGVIGQHVGTGRAEMGAVLLACRGAGPGFDRFLLTGFVEFVDLRQKLLVDERSFF